MQRQSQRRSGSSRDKQWHGTIVEPMKGFTIDKKGLDLSQGGTAAGRPAHTIMFLPLSNNEIVGLFDAIAGVMQAKQMPEGIAGNMIAMLRKITA